jgi:urease beta subunit
VYRLTYLKDTAIARFIDDSVLSNINSLIYMNSQEIVLHIYQNKDILGELLSKLRSADIQTKHDAVEFFMEVCQMSKNMQMGSRFNFFETMNSLNLIEVMAETFNIYYPDSTTLKAEAFEEQEGLVEYLLTTHKSDGKYQYISPEKIRPVIEDFLTPHEKYDIKKLDLLKINAIEILMNISTFAP